MECCVPHSIFASRRRTADARSEATKSSEQPPRYPPPDCVMIAETPTESRFSARFSGLMRRDPLHILRAASFTGFRGDRCVRCCRQVTIRPTTKNS